MASWNPLGGPKLVNLVYADFNFFFFLELAGFNHFDVLLEILNHEHG